MTVKITIRGVDLPAKVKYANDLERRERKNERARERRAIGSKVRQAAKNMGLVQLEGESATDYTRRALTLYKNGELDIQN